MWGKVGSCSEYHTVLQGAGVPKGTAQVLCNAQTEIGSDCEVWIKNCNKFQASLNLFVDTLLGGCKDEVLQVDLNFPKA